jgi:hypothetical protein
MLPNPFMSSVHHNHLIQRYSLYSVELKERHIIKMFNKASVIFSDDPCIFFALITTAKTQCLGGPQILSDLQSYLGFRSQQEGKGGESAACPSFTL